MIVPMTRLRVIAPRDRLDAVLHVAQDLGRLHVVPPATQGGLALPLPVAHEIRRRRQIERRLADADDAMRLLHLAPAAPPSTRPSLGGALQAAARGARAARRLAARELALRDEQATLRRYRAVLDAVLPVLQRLQVTDAMAAHAVVMPDVTSADQLRRALRMSVGPDVIAEARPLGDGTVVLVLVLPAALQAALDAQLAASRLPEIPLPEGYHEGLVQALPRLAGRLAAIPAALAALEQEQRQTAEAWRVPLLAARAVLADWHAAAEARGLVGLTPHVFVFEGWVPTLHLPVVTEALQRAAGSDGVIELVERAEWGDDEAPVVLQNPRVLRPFERLLGMLPLPRYGTLDPTPFLAVFFPLLFGVMLGDIGYAALLAAGAWWLRRRQAPGTVLRDAADVALACAAAAAIAGVLFGELFGDLGRRLLHLHPILFDRESAVLPAILLAVGLGFTHVLLGLILGAITLAHRSPRHALGRALSAVMLVLLLLALLALTNVLPKALFTPVLILLVAAVPVLIFAEGIIAPVELLATVGNVLSYARIMAIGTASVMLAVVANSMVGELGSVTIGVLFALLFHLVNFAIGLFSPAIHALRLHYVEFFGKFYDPGGRPYQPLAHWSPAGGRPSPTGGVA